MLLDRHQISPPGENKTSVKTQLMEDMQLYYVARAVLGALRTTPYCDRQQLERARSCFKCFSFMRCCSATFPFDGSVPPPLGCWGGEADTGAAPLGRRRGTAHPVLAEWRSPIRVRRRPTRASAKERVRRQPCDLQREQGGK